MFGPLRRQPPCVQRAPAACPDARLRLNRNYVVREIAAKTVFVMLYIGAVEGAECWLRPDQVTRMTDAQAVLHGYLPQRRNPKHGARVKLRDLKDRGG